MATDRTEWTGAFKACIYPDGVFNYTFVHHTSVACVYFDEVSSYTFFRPHLP